jgi:hypothetical protein
LIYAHHGDRFAPLPELLAEIFFHFSIQLSDLDGLRRPIGLRTSRLSIFPKELPRGQTGHKRLFASRSPNVHQFSHQKRLTNAIEFKPKDSETRLIRRP